MKNTARFPIGPWVKHFAWLPVYVPGGWVWLDWVLRQQQVCVTIHKTHVQKRYRFNYRLMSEGQDRGD